MLVTVDKNDFVISITPEATTSAVREITRSEAMPEATQLCKGPWHYRSGKGTPVPVSAFSMSRKYPSKRNKTCDECLERQNYRRVPPAAASMPVQSDIQSAYPDTNGGLQYKWEVTYVTTTTMTVYAKTYTEAGLSVGDVEILGVRRLD